MGVDHAVQGCRPLVLARPEAVQVERVLAQLQPPLRGHVGPVGVQQAAKLGDVHRQLSDMGMGQTGVGGYLYGLVRAIHSDLGAHDGVWILGAEMR